MANTTIKITQLQNIGNGLASNTLLPVVNTTGTAITQKVTVGNVANFIMGQAGNTLSPAFLSTLAYSVVNAAQPNITSVGTLNVNTLKISGGVNGYVLQTDGASNLAWVAQSGSGNGNPGGSNSQLQFNNGGVFAGDPDLTWDAGNNKLTTANLVASTVTISGNANTVNLNATGNVRTNAIYTDHYYYANGYVFGGGGGNGAPGGTDTQIQFNDNGVFGGNTGFTFDKVTGTISSPFLVGNGNGLSNIQGANVSGAVAIATYATNIAGANVTGAVTYAATANSVAVANVVGIGNIATLALDGSTSNVLYGNGVFAPVAITYSNSNVVTLLSSFGSNTITTAGNITLGNAIFSDGSTLSGSVLATEVSANIFAGTSLPGLETDYTDSVVMLDDAFTQNSGEAGYPWGITLPVSYLTYDELIELSPDTFPNQTAVTTIANNVQNTYELWQDTIAQTNVTLTSNEFDWVFDNDGTLTVAGNIVMPPGSTLRGVGASPAPSISGFDSASFGGNLNVTGNITGGNIIGNGSTLSNVATKTSGSWSLADGVNTVSIAVPVNGTYSIWVIGNIPNGIITYTATAVVTNPNVPVLGEQYAWYYATGNALVFTSIPDQFVGTQGAISNTTPYSGTTSNVFTFGITNNSGSSQFVNWGYTKL
jgi:hypothetical protein